VERKGIFIDEDPLIRARGQKEKVCSLSVLFRKN
jgi:hypothetical protein